LGLFSTRRAGGWPTKREVKRGGIPHLAKNERDTPNFLHAAPDMTECAAFIKESRMKFTSAYNLDRKSGIWATLDSWKGKSPTHS
jgi:hypothetical protein